MIVVVFNFQGRNTYTGQGFENVHVGFTGPLTASFHAFPNLRPFGKALSNDPRHRDMTHAEAKKAMGTCILSVKVSSHMY